MPHCSRLWAECHGDEPISLAPKLSLAASEVGQRLSWPFVHDKIASAEGQFQHNKLLEDAKIQVESGVTEQAQLKRPRSQSLYPEC